MSKNDIKAMFIIMSYFSVMRQGHLKVFAKEFEPLFYNLKNLYPASKLTQNHQREIMRLAGIIDDNIEKLDLNNTVVFILSYIMGTAEEFYKHCTGNRKQAWGDLIDNCMNNELIKHILKKRDYSEVERSEIFIDMMFEELKKL